MASTPDLFRALADQTRVRIVNLLSRSSLCVCDIQNILGEPQSTVSRHLAYLKNAGLLKHRREGVRVFYALVPISNKLQRAVVGAIRTHITGTHATFRRDLVRLRNVRKLGPCHGKRARG